MNNRYFRWLLLSCLAWVLPTARADKIVEPSADPAQYLNRVIAADVDGLGNRTETTYILRRGGIYLIDGVIENNGWALTIKAEEGTGARPQIIPLAGTGGSVLDPLITVRGNLTLEGLYLTGQNDLGLIAQRILRAVADNLRITFRDCHFDYSAQSALRGDNSGAKVYVIGSLFTNMGRMNSPDNGRAIDMRGTQVDSVIFDNSTFYNITSRSYRAGGGTANYARFNHNTIVNSGQRLLDFDISARQLIITNNLLMNGGVHGVSAPDPGEEDPEGLIYLDTLETLTGQEIPIQATVRNNNIYLDPAVRTAIAAYDGDPLAPQPEYVVRPDFEPYLRDILAANGDLATNTAEALAFTNAPVTTQRLIDVFNALRDGNTATVVDFESRANPFDPLPTYDFRYPTTAASYTGSTAGQPLGALTWFGQTIVSTETFEALPDGFQLHAAYPNPFNPATTLRYDLERTGLVRLSVYDMLGREVATVVNARQTPGSYAVSFDAAAQPSGLYLVRLDVDGQRQTQKITLIK